MANGFFRAVVIKDLEVTNKPLRCKHTVITKIFGGVFYRFYFIHLIAVTQESGLENRD
jgi:hypothetical protein